MEWHSSLWPRESLPRSHRPRYHRPPSRLLLPVDLSLRPDHHPARRKVCVTTSFWSFIIVCMCCAGYVWMTERVSCRHKIMPQKSSHVSFQTFVSCGLFPDHHRQSMIYDIWQKIMREEYALEWSQSKIFLVNASFLYKLWPIVVIILIIAISVASVCLLMK